ncbi:MAG: MerR family DNA-binding protein, partial [Nitratireductor sp.]|nr:MerR family DNA-binding protein [Nitratireductor sp.]
GLVSPHRRANGYRDYGDGDVHKLRFLARARGLGFTIEECRQLLALYDDKHRASSEVKAMANARIDAIDKKIAELESLKSMLNHLA